MRSVLTLVFVLFLTPLSAQAQGACYVKAGDYEPWLKAYERDGPDDSVTGLRAIEYARGVADGLLLPGHVCIPDGANGSDLMSVIRSGWLEALSNSAALPSKTCASAVLAFILVERFPCAQPEETVF